MAFEIGKLTRLPLGYVGETESRVIEINVSDWLERWPGAVIVVTHVRPDEYGYIAATEVQNGVLSWTVTAGDVAVAGKGFAQIRAMDFDTGAIYKSRVVGTIVSPSLEGFDDPEAPDPMSGWVAQVVKARDEAEAAAGQVSAARDEALTAIDEAIGDVNAASDAAQAELDRQVTLLPPPIVQTLVGTNVNATDSADQRAFESMSLMGRSWQGGEPSIEYPQDINSIPAGNVNINVNNVLAATIALIDELRGVPVKENGNYTDTNGQQWICDEIDLARGVRIQRCAVRTFDGTSGTPNYYNGHCRIMTTGQSTQSAGLCDKLPYKSTAYASGGMSNNGVCFSVPGSVVGCASTEEWAAWLAANPLTVTYVLAAPVETALSDEEIAAFAAMRSTYPSMNVNNDQGIDMVVGYVADTKNYIDMRIAALAAAALGV